MTKLLIALLIALPLAAQWAASPTTSYSALNTWLDARVYFRVGTSVPATCVLGKEVYTDSGTNLPYWCSTTNTFARLALYSDLSGYSLTSHNHTGTYIATGGNAGTATALAANGSNCSAGSFPLGVDASGAAESCTAANSIALTLAQTALTTRGDLMVANTSTPVLGRLAKGTQYQVLTGGATDLTWGAVALDQATAISGILPSANGGTANAYFTVSGPATAAKTFTFPNASATVLTSNAAVTVAQGGTGVGTLTGIVKGSGTSNFAAAASSDVIGLWTGTCSASTYLKGDGSCGTPSGTGIVSMTTGAGGASGNCTAPGAGNLTLYTDTTAQDVWACVATNVWKKILSTTDSGTYVVTGAVGSAPSRPSTGNLTCYYDTTYKLQICLDSGTQTAVMVVADAARTANQFCTHVSAAGVCVKAALASADIPNNAANTSGSAASFASQYIDWSAASGGASIANKPTLYNQTIQDEGSGVTQRAILNFAGAGVSCADDTTKTTCTIAGGGGGDASTNTATSVDNEVALFSSTGGKTLKRAAGTGFLKTTSGVASNVVLALPYGCAVGDPAGSALATGVLCYITVPTAGTITGWDIVVDGGTATVDVWKVAAGTAKPTVSNTITASAKPAIASGTAIHSTTLTSWTTSVAANDILGFNLDAVATAKYITVNVQVAH